LQYKLNRWANIVAGIIMTVVQSLILLPLSPTIYYVFFSIIEIATTALIVWYAGKRLSPEPDDLPVDHHIYVTVIL
jgi:membrane protein implicated in regulation of membrane protease activity